MKSPPCYVRIIMIPDWVWRLYEPYLRKEAERRGMARPLTRELARILAEFWPECSARLMVQEPWMGTIRFKRLAKYDAESVLPLAEAPEAYIRIAVTELEETTQRILADAKAAVAQGGGAEALLPLLAKLLKAEGDLTSRWAELSRLVSDTQRGAYGELIRLMDEAARR
ncbi:MAG: hypothetical protein HYS14_01265 [Candidatus Rokubacteria bacterium]|nr:hypothetical protein [Candidatus Rokubacteria bacterium]